VVATSSVTGRSSALRGSLLSASEVAGVKEVDHSLDTLLPALEVLGV
jgi:hypothetical protein